MAAFAMPSFANLHAETTKKPTKTVSKEIKEMIQDLNLDIQKLHNETIKLKFMVNENGELIVISTEESKLDKTLKAALNYKKVDSEGLTPYHPYIVPIKFELT